MVIRFWVKQRLQVPISILLVGTYKNVINFEQNPIF